MEYLGEELPSPTRPLRDSQEAFEASQVAVGSLVELPGRPKDPKCSKLIAAKVKVSWVPVPGEVDGDAGLTAGLLYH